MSEHLVLTVIARDRPGIIRAISEVITRHSGNWVDSSMGRLAGEFAGILLIAAPAAGIAALEADLIKLADSGITVQTRRAASEPAAPKGKRIFLELTGADHAGIIAEISGEIARLGASIDELSTRVFPGSMSGTSMFEAHADLVLPEGLDEEAVRERLEDIADDLMVEIEVELPGDKKNQSQRRA